MKSIASRSYSRIIAPFISHSFFLFYNTCCIVRYQVLHGDAQHTEVSDQDGDAHLVVYRALYGEKWVWCRPLSMWNEAVEVRLVFACAFIIEIVTTASDVKNPAAWLEFICCVLHDNHFIFQVRISPWSKEIFRVFRLSGGSTLA